ncbi:MAG: ral secretion pathway protein GspF [Gammaproteobacteria bacterium]|jgi:hypothetical protein|nr:ral secretion pathway protein GspF [Gammaproteobacteria bacterium]
MFFIQKKLPRPRGPNEPLLFPDHKVPVTRRELLSAGLRTAPALVVGPAWLASALKPNKANAALSADIQALLDKTQCNVATNATGIPVICFDLAGGANLVGSEVIVGQKGGQANFLTTAAYGKMGLPGNMVPSAAGFTSSTFGLLWHSDGAILRGMLTKATTPATAAGTNGAVICGMSQNDTGQNPHNPMYGIAMTGARGKLLNLVGNQSSMSGGNSAAPPYMVNPLFQPTTIAVPADDVALVSTGGAPADPVSIAVIESQARISGGSALYDPANTAGTEFTGVLAPPNGSQTGSSLYAGGGAQDVALKSQVRCSYAQSAYTADAFGNPSSLDPTQDPLITGGASPIFTAADFSDNDIKKTASVMKLVCNGYAAAGTITLGGYDYHTGDRVTGETKNFKAGQMIGAVLEYAQRVGSPVMIYVFSDGSLTSSSMVDNSTGGRGKLAWQGDNQSVSSTFFLVYSPKGRPQPVNGAASQQIGYFTAAGSVDATSSPAANSVTQIPEVMILNYLGLTGQAGQFSSFFPMQGLGSASAQAALTAFGPIV